MSKKCLSVSSPLQFTYNSVVKKLHSIKKRWNCSGSTPNHPASQITEEYGSTALHRKLITDQKCLITMSTKWRPLLYGMIPCGNCSTGKYWPSYYFWYVAEKGLFLSISAMVHKLFPLFSETVSNVMSSPLHTTCLYMECLK